MVDPNDGVTSSAPATQRCPWCSAELPDPAAATCLSCTANVAGGPEPQVPGLTALDLERLAFRRSTTPKKSRLLSWISGDSDDDGAPGPVATPESIAPPSADVRREMFRIEKAALIADLAAQAGVLATDDALALGEADPAAAAAAIQAQLNVAARAQAEDVAAEGVSGASFAGDVLGPAAGTEGDGGSSTTAADESPAEPEGVALSAAPTQSKPRRRFRR